MLVHQQITSLFAVFVLISTPAIADVHLPHVISDHMVLQRERLIPIWGWAEPGEVVKVTLADLTATTTADDKGQFRIDLPAMKAGGPHKLVVEGKNSLTFPDILVGEVWVCFGQSNMQWKLSQTPTGGQDIAKSADPQLRVCNVDLVVATVPQSDGGASWSLSAPGSVGNFSAVAYYFGKHLRETLDVPVGLINASAGAIPIESFTPAEGCELIPSQAKFVRLASQVRTDIHQARKAALKEAVESWTEKARAAIAAETPVPPMPPIPPVKDAIVQRGWMPLGLFNGAINPLIPFGIRGVVLYQGEANNGQGIEYFEKMQALIGGWRKRWGQGDFPFLFVQLAPWSGYPQGNLEGIWDAQRLSLSIPNTGMAVTTDLVPDINDIHPPRKKEVGDRLAMWALGTTYGQDKLVYSGPLFKSASIIGNKIRVHFDHVGSGLTSRDNKPLDNWQIGTTEGFVEAQANIENDTVLVWSEQVPNPQFVRFGWKNTAQSNLINKEGLPASPFRTDCAPVVFSTGNKFAGHKLVQLSADAMMGEIRYTLDGSAPTERSPTYSAPLQLTQTTTVSARFFANDGRSSLTSKSTYTRTKSETFGGKTLGPGIDYEYYVGRWVEMPNFALLKADRNGVIDLLKPTVFPESFMCSHRFHGYLSIPKDGQYTFQLTERDRRLTKPSADAYLSAEANFLIDGRPLVDHSPTFGNAANPPASLATGRAVRVRLEGEGRMLCLAEVQILEAVTKSQLQLAGKSSQSSTGYGCPPERASDGNTNSTYGGGSISHTGTEKNPWWSIDLGNDKSIGQIKIFNRGDCCGERLSNAIVEILDGQGKVVWSSRIATVDTGSIDEFISGESCTLSAGMHPFELTYREGGTPALKLLYEGPGIERQEVPASAFFREEK